MPPTAAAAEVGPKVSNAVLLVQQEDPDSPDNNGLPNNNDLPNHNDLLNKNDPLNNNVFPEDPAPLPNATDGPHTADSSEGKPLPALSLQAEGDVGPTLVGDSPQPPSQQDVPLDKLG